MLVVTLLTAGLLTLFNTQLLRSTESALSTQAFLAAETGVSLGKAYITTNASWQAGLPRSITGAIGQASFTSVVAAAGVGTARITSTGRRDPTAWTSLWEGEGTRIQALAVYRDTSGSDNFPRWRGYNQFHQVLDEQMALTAANPPQWQRLAASPKTNEFLLVTQNSGGRIYGQAWTNNTWYAATLLNSAAAGTAYRGFDAAYENLSGEGLAVYSDSDAGGSPRYRTWDGSQWSAEATLTNIAAGYPICWVRLAPQPGSDNILCLVRWRKTNNPKGNYSSAVVWNGGQWGNVTNLEVLSGSTIDYDTMDVACSSNRALAVYTDATTTPRYRTWNGTNWSGDGSVGAALSAQPRWIRVEFSSNGADAFAAFLDANDRLNGKHWTPAGGWDAAYTNFGTSGGVRLESSATRCFDIAWGRQTNALMVTYAVFNQTAHSYMIQPQGGAASYGTLAAIDDGRWSALRADPYAPEFVYLSLDDQSDVNFQRWNGSAWSLVAELETASNLSYDSIALAFRLDLAP